MFLLLGLLIAALVGFSSGSAGTPRRVSDYAPTQTQRASLRFVSMHPLVVRGWNFHRGERVRLTVFTGHRKVQKSVLAPNRVFAAGFPVIADPCAGPFAVAVGNEGSRAAVHTMPRACPPPERLPRSP